MANKKSPVLRFAQAGFTAADVAFIEAVTSHSRAWGVRFAHVLPSEPHDVEVFKLSGDVLDGMFPAYLHGLSVTDRRTTPVRVYFRAENWDAVPRASGYGKDLRAYRTYLVLHEFGHVLGHGHTACPCPGAPAPIMMQQTRGTDGCVPDPWVVKQ